VNKTFKLPPQTLSKMIKPVSRFQENPKTAAFNLNHIFCILYNSLRFSSHRYSGYETAHIE
jgi:hypothetical protein